MSSYGAASQAVSATLRARSRSPLASSVDHEDVGGVDDGAADGFVDAFGVEQPAPSLVAELAERKPLDQ